MARACRCGHWEYMHTPKGGPCTMPRCGCTFWDNSVRKPSEIAATEKEHSTMDKPSVGRIIHYVAYGTPGGEFPAGVCRAAIITEVEAPDIKNPDASGDRIGLCAINPTGLFFNRGIKYDEGKSPGTWHWPERS